MVLTNSQEEYLKVIYLLNNAMGEVRVTDIANKMNKTKASVTAAVNVLAQMNLIEYKHYEPIKITKNGELEAIKVLEASNIVKLFMTDILNIDFKDLNGNTSSPINLKFSRGTISFSILCFVPINNVSIFFSLIFLAIDKAG